MEIEESTRLGPAPLRISFWTNSKTRRSPSLRISMISWKAFPRRGYFWKKMDWNSRLPMDRIIALVRVRQVKWRSVLVSSSISPKKELVV